MSLYIAFDVFFLCVCLYGALQIVRRLHGMTMGRRSAGVSFGKTAEDHEHCCLVFTVTVS
jgi:hypothetical protein